MTWSHVTKVEKIKTRLGLMDRLQWWRASQGFEATNHMWRGSLSKDLAPIDKATMKSKLSWDWWTNKVTWWYEVDHIFQGRSSKVLTYDDNQKAWSRLVLVWHQHLGRWNRMRKAKVWLLGHFISPVKGYVEKCMTRFRIDGRTIKRGKLICISVI